MRAKALSKVDLPQPLGPIKAVTFPVGGAKDRPCTMRVVP